MVHTDLAAVTRRLGDQLGAIVRALEAFQGRLTIPQYSHIVRTAADASVALSQGDRVKIELSLEELDGAARILASVIAMVEAERLTSAMLPSLKNKES